MIASLLMAQAIMQVPDTKPLPSVPATAFRCTFLRAPEESGAVERFDLHGALPPIPKNGNPKGRITALLQSDSGSPITGKANVLPLHSSEWFREYEMSLTSGTARYVVSLKLRREGRSIGHISVYDSAWKSGEPEPYRYDAVGICAAQFDPAGAPS